MRRLAVSVVEVVLFIASLALPVVVMLPVLWFVCRELAVALDLAKGTFWRSAVEYLVPAALTGLAVQKALKESGRLLNRLEGP